MADNDGGKRVSEANPLDRFVMLPIGSLVQWQHWVIARDDAWIEAVIAGPPKMQTGGELLYPVRHADGFEHLVNLDACAHVRQAT